MFNLFYTFSQTGQKNSLTQETELLESLLQEVEHQVCSILVRMQYITAHHTMYIVFGECCNFRLAIDYLDYGKYILKHA